MVWVDLHANFCGGLWKMHLFCNSAYRPFKVIQCRWFLHQLKGVCDFLLDINSNFGTILHHFWDTTTYWLKIANFSHSNLISFNEFLDKIFNAKTIVLGLSLGEDFEILACVVLTRCQRVTDGWTDGQKDNPTVANTGLCIASYGDAL